LTFLNENSDTLLIGYFLGDFCLGYYAIAYRVFQVLTQLLVKTITQVTFPALSRLQNESQRLLSAFYQIVQHANLATIPVFLMVVLLSQELVLVVFGEQWLPSSSAMQVLTCSGIVYSVMTFNKSLLIATGQPLWQLKLEALNVVFNIASCLFAVRWGILAVAYAYAVSDLLVVPISLWVLKLTVCLSLEEYLKRFLSPFSCAVAMVITIGVTKYYLSVELSSYLVLISCTLIGVVSYVSCLLCLDPGLFKTALKVIKLR
ncbi:MAG: oligosaccharide flippase family protein, partial [Cyanobacteria bacterium J06621_3]